jgi:hypothetical protein
MIQPMPAFFLVRVPIQEQAERKDKKGLLHLHPNYIYMTRGMQCGEIEAIGARAHGQFPEARIGDTLLFHHFVESTEKPFLVDKDKHFHYYVVTGYSHNGNNTMTYGCFNGEQIFAHPQYLFIEVPKTPAGSLTPEQYLDEHLSVTPGGLLTFTEWRVDRVSLTERMQELKKQSESLLKSEKTPPILKAVRELEEEMNSISQQLSARKYETYTLLAAHPSFLEHMSRRFQYPISAGDLVLMLDIACETKMEFHGTEYIVAKALHFGAPYGWLQQQLISTKSVS